jgi:hypothetical protein
MAEANEKTCFVVMPMSDGGDYPVGHWDLVYDELFVPACAEAGFEVDRADSNKNTALIIADVLRRLHKADMVLCDLSSLRPNVMFELGLRQAFDQPVVLARDERTTRPFDTSQLRDVPYDSSLRVDLVRERIDGLAEALKETYANRATGEFSLVRLLAIGVAQPARPAGEDAVQRAIFGALDRLAAEVSSLKSAVTMGPQGPQGLSGAYGLTAAGGPTGMTGPQGPLTLYAAGAPAPSKFGFSRVLRPGAPKDAPPESVPTKDAPPKK